MILKSTFYSIKEFQQCICYGQSIWVNLLPATKSPIYLWIHFGGKKRRPLFYLMMGCLLIIIKIILNEMKALSSANTDISKILKMVDITGISRNSHQESMNLMHHILHCQFQCIISAYSDAVHLQNISSNSDASYQKNLMIIYALRKI